MNIYARFYEGEKRSKGAFGRPVPPVCDVHEQECDGVTLVYADVISAWPLDPDFGVGPWMVCLLWNWWLECGT